MVLIVTANTGEGVQKENPYSLLVGTETKVDLREANMEALKRNMKILLHEPAVPNLGTYLKHSK